MLDTHAILIDFILILGSATIVATIFHSLHLPPIVGFLMAGILAGPHGLGLVKTLPRVEILTEIAGVLLMFTIGLEFSIRRLLALRQSLLSLGAGQMGLTIGICLPLFHYIFEFSWSQSFFFASLISLSSTAVVFKLLKDGRDLESPFGQASLSILLFQDISVIPLLLLVPFIAGGTNSSIEPFSLALLGRFLFKSIGLILFILVGTRLIVPYALERVARTRSSEVFFFAILFIGGGTALLINSIGLSLSLGAFFAGLMISSSPYGKQATAEFTPLRDNFLGLFFVAIGMLLSVQFLGTHILEILGLSISALLIKFFCIFIVLWITGHASTIALITAMMLFQVGEFSFILADQGR
ncbi:MAG: cation:proton antiporter, partial [Bdellovibrionales bacterium]|nr:cation:proton antiporter [Bdellovibrionales bacterium]